MTFYGTGVVLCKVYTTKGATMDFQKAKALAAALGGHYFNSGGGVYLVYIEREDGAFVAFSDECVAVYPSLDAIGDVDAVLASIDLV